MKKINFRRLLVSALCIIFVLSLSSCAWLSAKTKNVKGELIGNNFSIDFYDNFGNNILSMEGKKVGMEANYTKSKSINSDGTSGTSYALTSVVTITIDGSQAAQTGNTVIFAEKGIEKLEDFDVPNELQSSGNGTINIFDRNINKIKNILGTPKIIIVCSQLGTPIAVYGGDDVYWEIPDDLPKTTKVNIDGQALYIHRANYILIDNDLIK